LMFACSAQDTTSPETNHPISKSEKHDPFAKYYKRTLNDYSAAKASCVSLRQSLASSYQQAGSDAEQKKILIQAQHSFTQSLVLNVFPFWYGTEWDFNGYTAIPKQGKVACGYFVSTTLLHSGLNINRFKLAQLGPRHEALSLSLADSVLELQDMNPEMVRKYFVRNNFDDGLYFVGLDFHVGYLLKEQDDLFFIHSNWIGAKGVVIEDAVESEAFRSNYYYIAPISTNQRLVEKWLLNKPVATYTGS
jgi:hypothetical protein